MFVRSSRKPTASVFLTLQGGSTLSDTQVDAIANKDWQVETRVLRWHYVPTPYSAPVQSVVPLPSMPGESRP